MLLMMIEKKFVRNRTQGSAEQRIPLNFQNTVIKTSFMAGQTSPRAKATDSTSLGKEFSWYGGQLPSSKLCG